MDNNNPKPQPNQLAIEINPQTTKVSYSNLAIISHSRSEFVLDFATTRPETIMADAAICVNPNDERHHWLRGKKVLIPLINREIP